MSIEKYTKQVSGENRGDVLLFALSTCGWCRKTKMLLNELGVEYRYLDADLLFGEAKNEVVRELDRWNPSRSFPTLVINSKGIVGYQEQKVREALGHGGS
jgi:glutaredoxin-like protein NrdH